MEAKDQAEKQAAVQIRKAEISGLNEKVKKIVAVKTQQKIQEAQDFNLKNLQLSVEMMEKEEKAQEEQRLKNQELQKQLQQ